MSKATFHELNYQMFDSLFNQWFIVIMRGKYYYEDPEYSKWLLSRERMELFPPELILSQIKTNDIENMMDFGMGNGFFTPWILKKIPKHAWLWGVECQEVVIDRVLKRKTDENWKNFTVFYIERTEHPLLPDWIPEPDLIFCSCVLSTFADPSLAIAGIGRRMKNEGKIYILEWEKKEAPAGPDVIYKISENRLRYSVEEAGFRVNNKLKVNDYLFFLEIVKDEKAKAEKNRFSYLNY